MRILITALALTLCACSTPAPTPTPAPTATPAPTSTPAPTLTPTSEFTPTPVSYDQCIDWSQAPQHIGENVCVSGTVYAADYADDNRFHVTFDPSPTSLLVDSHFGMTDVEGSCVKAFGTIRQEDHRPRLRVETIDQIGLCSMRPGRVAPTAESPTATSSAASSSAP